MLYGIESLLERVRRLEDAGKIDARAAHAISEEFRPDLEKSRLAKKTFAHVLLCCLGIGLFACGLKIFAESVWYELTQTERTAVALLPLAASIAFAVWARAADASRAARETAALFNAFCLFYALTLVGDIWQMPPNKAGFFASMFLLTFPMAAIMRSASASAFAVVMLWFFPRLGGKDFFGDYYNAFFIVCSAAIVVYAVRMSKTDKMFRLPVFLIALLMPFAALIVADFKSWTADCAFMAVVYGAIAACSAGNSARFLRIVPIAMFAAVCASAIFRTPSKPLQADAACCLWIAAGAFFWGIQFFARIRRRNGDASMLAFSLLAPFGVACFVLEVSGGGGTVPTVAAAFMSAVGLFALFDGIKSTSYAKLNAGLLVFLAALFSIIDNDNTFSMGTRSAWFVVSGLLIIGLNAFVSRRKKDEN